MKRCLIVPSRTCGPVLALLLAAASLSADDSKDLSKAEIARLGKAATALVEAGRRYYGSAFCVHPSGLFVTNNHVLQNQTSEVNLILNTGLPGQARSKATVVRRDQDLDLALLRVEGAKDLSALTLGSAEGLHELMELVAFGYPFGRDLAARPGEYPAPSVNMASVSSLHRKDGDLIRIQLDAAVNPGNSGGPLVDLKGTVVGVIVGRVEARFGAGIDLAIPVSHVKQFLARPDISFEPPAECAVNQSIDFRAKAISVLPSQGPLDLELIVGAGRGDERRYPMKLIDGSYHATAIPFLEQKGAALVRVDVKYEDGSVSGQVEDQGFRVGSQTIRLSQIRNLRFGPKGRVELTDRRTLEGALADLAALTLKVGGQSLRVDLSAAAEIVVDSANGQTATSCIVVARQDGQEVGRKSAPVYLEGVARATLDAVREAKFIKPPRSAVPVSYLRAVSSKGDYIGQGKTYSYSGEDLVVRRTQRGVGITVDGWTIEFGGPGTQFLGVGEYLNAKRHAFSGDSPGINFSGNGRGCNRIAGAFAVWELEVKGNEIVRLAIDFVQRCEERMPPLYGMIRFNSSFH